MQATTGSFRCETNSGLYSLQMPQTRRHLATRMCVNKSYSRQIHWDWSCKGMLDEKGQVSIIKQINKHMCIQEANLCCMQRGKWGLQEDRKTAPVP